MKTDDMKSEIFFTLAAAFLLMLWHLDAEYVGALEEQKAFYDKQKQIYEMEIGDRLKPRKQDNPPIIMLSEQEQRFRFDLGSARIPPYFVQALKKVIIPLVDSLSHLYKCDAIEVVGHTDEVPVKDLDSNLDQNLATFFSLGQIEDLTPGSNLDLGMMRALAIIQLLTQSRLDGRLSGIDFFFPYSAGQVILLDRQTISEDTGIENRARRRIEIRLLNSATRQLESFQ